MSFQQKKKRNKTEHNKQDYLYICITMPLQLTIYRAGSNIPALPGNNTFHSTELFHIYEATPGYTPLLVVASLNGQPVAKLLGVVRRSVRLTPPALIKRCEVYGTGEYFVPDEQCENIFGEMLRKLTHEALRRSFLIEFRNLDDPRFGYRFFRQNHVNHIAVYLNVLSHETDEGELQRLAFLYINGVLAVNVGNATIGCTYFQYVHARKRRAGSVRYGTGHSVLCEC